jgi:hypothetical protein
VPCGACLLHMAGAPNLSNSGEARRAQAVGEEDTPEQDYDAKQRGERGDPRSREPRRIAFFQCASEQNGSGATFLGMEGIRKHGHRFVSRWRGEAQ